MRATDRLSLPVRRSALALMGLFVCTAWCLAQTQTPGADAPRLAGGKIPVEDVIPKGTRFVPPQKIIGLIKPRPGTEYSPEIVQEDVRRLWETRLFANIRVQTQQTGNNKIKVFFVVAEYP